MHAFVKVCMHSHTSTNRHICCLHACSCLPACLPASAQTHGRAHAHAALRKATTPPGVDGFSILNEEFPALPGTSGRSEEAGAPAFTGARAAGAAAAGLQQQASQQPQPTTARGGLALMPAVSGADAAYGGGTGGGDAAMRAQVGVGLAVG